LDEGQIDGVLHEFGRIFIVHSQKFQITLTTLATWALMGIEDAAVMMTVW